MFTEAILKTLYPRASAEHIRNFARLSGPLLEEFGINSKPNRWQFFLAQVGHESGGLTIVVENMNYRAERMMEVWPSRFPTLASARPFAGKPEKLGNNVYANRMGNGPPESGDGFRYRGRGYIQITGKDGYEQVGSRTGLDLVGNPDFAATAENALRVACGFWKWKDLNPLCDKGDFTDVTRRINGGTTGLKDRQAWLDKVRRTFATPPAAGEQPPAAAVIDLQKHLQAEGFKEIGAADGNVGPRTMAVLETAQDKGKLPKGGPLKKVLDALGIGKKKKKQA